MQKHLKVVSTNNIDATPNKQKTVLKKGLHIQLRDGVWQAHIFYKNQTVRKSTAILRLQKDQLGNMMLKLDSKYQLDLQ